MAKQIRRTDKDDSEAVQRSWFQTGKLLTILIPFLTGMLGAGGTGWFVKDSLTTDTVKQVITNTSDIRAEKLKLEAHIREQKATETLKDDNVKLQIKNIENQVKGIRTDQGRMKSDLEEIKRLLIKAQKQ